MRSPYIVSGYAFYWKFPSATERTAYIGSLAEEGRIAWQSSDNTLWFLSSAPSIWTRVGEVAGISNPAPAEPSIGTSYIAHGPISGHKVMAAYFNNSVVQASHSDLSTMHSVLGISSNAAIDGDPVTVISKGVIVEPTWNWEANKPIFLGPNGSLVQSAPSTGYDLVVGVATSQQSMQVDIKLPILK